MKRFYLMLVAAIASNAFAADFEVNGIAYNTLSNTTVEVTYLNDGLPYTGDIVIPSKVSYENNEYNVIAIGDYAFGSCESISSITLPEEGIISFGLESFSKLTITSFTIPASVKDIDVNAFSRSYDIAFTLPEGSNFVIEDNMLFNNEKTLLLAIPRNVEGDYTMPNTIVAFPKAGFRNSNLSKITLSSSLDSIPFYAFNKTIEEIIVPEGVKKIGEYGFASLPNITHINLPTSITSIGEFAFMDTPLEEIDIPEGVVSIKASAFYNNSKLTKVTLPSTLREIRFNAFGICDELTEIIIKDGLVSIGDYAFHRCSAITSINLPQSVKIIDEGAFSNCSQLSQFDFANVETIGATAFGSCGFSGVLNLPNTLKTIGIAAFQLNEELTEVNLPASVELIESAAFADNYNLTAINVDAANANYSSSEGVVYNKDKTALIACPAGKSGEFTIDGNVTTIGDGAFEGCSKLVGITLPEQLVTIGNNAFYSCEKVIGLNLPSTLTSIGEMAFCNMKSITELNIPGVKVLPQTVAGCCDNLVKLVINEGTEVIDYYAFYYNFSLTEVILPSTLKSIGNYAFYYDYALEDITLPASLEYIDYCAFDQCYMSSVTSLSTTPPAVSEHVESTPRYNPFSSSLDGTLYVPVESIDAYKDAIGWRSFENFAAINTTSVNEIDATDMTDELVDIYNIQGVRILKGVNPSSVNDLPTGLYIVGGKKVSIKH